MCCHFSLQRPDQPGEHRAHGSHKPHESVPRPGSELARAERQAGQVAHEREGSEEFVQTGSWPRSDDFLAALFLEFAAPRVHLVAACLTAEMPSCR